jgi:hypothetical protein
MSYKHNSKERKKEKRKKERKNTINEPEIKKLSYNKTKLLCKK